MAIEYASLNNLQTLTEEILKRIPKVPDVPEYSVRKSTSVNTNLYSAVYELTKNGSPIGEKINIPKDYLVRSASVETCKTVDTPVKGYKVGDKYIDFVVNTADNSGTENHIYLLVTDLVDVYKSGSGITVGQDNTISLNVRNDDLFYFTSNGQLNMYSASDTHDGYMSKEDKTKLDGLPSKVKEYTAGDGVRITDDDKITLKVEGITDDGGVDDKGLFYFTENGELAIHPASSTNDGYMSSEDKRTLTSVNNRKLEVRDDGVAIPGNGGTIVISGLAAKEDSVQNSHVLTTTKTRVLAESDFTEITEEEILALFE